MKTIKKALGSIMVSSAFVGLFIMTCHEHGVIESIKVWLIAIGLVTLIVVGIHLVFEDYK